MFENSNTKSIRRTGLIKRDDRESKNTSCNRKTNASMRSSIVLTFLSLPVLEGTHERVILLFEFPILAFVVVIFLRFRVLVVSLLGIFCVRMYARGVLLH